MKWCLCLTVLVLWFKAHDAYITWIEKRFPLPGTPSPPGSPWPMPQIHDKFDLLATLDPKQFAIHTNIVDCDVIDQAIKRYTKYIFIENSAPDPNLSTLKDVNLYIEDSTCYELPSLESEEKYTITVASDGKCNGTHDDPQNHLDTHADILAHSIWGALRALETFAQLVWQRENSTSLVMNQTVIVDYPRYKHRGLLLDTARHFQPLSVIKKNLNAMEWNKLNVFHWHIVDDQSFPFESHVFPNLTTEGAYSPKHVYTQKEIGDVIEYARLRGIRVILEFDTPGHTMGFGRAFPELLTPCYGDGSTPGTANYSVPHSEREILDPTKNFTYEFMTRFFEEVRTVLKDDYVHLGMDEVYYGCWASSPEIREFMDKHGYQTLAQVEQHYVRWMIDMVKKQNFKYITWQDPVDNGVEVNQFFFTDLIPTKCGIVS